MITEFRIVCVILAAVVLASCSHTEPSLQAKSAESEPSTVVPVPKVSRENIASKTVLTAEFQPFQEVDVMAKVAGYVRSIKVDIGSHVRAGQVLAELEVPEMTDDVSRAAALVEQTGSQIATARDELQRAESSHQMAHLSYTRLQEVAKREPGLIPQQEVDEVRSRDLMAEAQMASARSRLRVEENKTQVAKAEETRIKTMRNYLTITASFSGTVTKRYANLGSMIQAGTASQSQAMPLVRLSQISTLRLSLPVPESLVSTIRVGQPVEAHVQSLSRSFQGRVARYAGRLDSSTRTMIAEVDVPNPNGAILPGMYAEVTLEIAQHDAVLCAPLEAIERTGGTARVYQVDKGGVVRVVPVQIGVEDAGRAEILSGLKEGDLVITGRRAALKAGDKVRPKLLEAQT